MARISLSPWNARYECAILHLRSQLGMTRVGPMYVEGIWPWFHIFERYSEDFTWKSPIFIQNENIILLRTYLPNCKNIFVTYDTGNNIFILYSYFSLMWHKFDQFLFGVQSKRSVRHRTCPNAFLMDGNPISWHIRYICM